MTLLHTNAPLKRLNYLFFYVAVCMMPSLFAAHETFYSADTALPKAIAANDAKTVRLVLETTDVNTADRFGYTALHIATTHELPRMVTLLLLAGADVHKQNDRGQTALHIAANRKLPDIVCLLLKAGADIDLPDQQGKTALIEAALINSLWFKTQCAKKFRRVVEDKRITKKRIEVIKELLNRGALVPTVETASRGLEESQAPRCRQDRNAACSMIAEHIRHANGWAWQSEKYLRKKTDLPQALISLICSFATNAKPVAPPRTKRFRAYLAQAL